MYTECLEACLLFSSAITCQVKDISFARSTTIPLCRFAPQVLKDTETQEDIDAALATTAEAVADLVGLGTASQVVESAFAV